MSAVSKWGNPLPEGCHIFLDLRQLPEAQDGSDDLVPLSPFTIEWGVEKPWDETNPAVLNITLIDQGGRYSKSANGLMGHRLTVRPAWELQGTYNESPLCYALFDGYVTDVQMLDHDGGRNRIKLTASDRIYILRADCRKGPNDGTDAQAARGFQWWLQGIVDATLKRWLNFDGIPAYDITYNTFSTPPKASDRHSFMDFCERKVTRQIDGKYSFEVDRMFYMSYQDASAAKVPQFRDIRAFWNTDVILTGPTIVLGDGSTTINDDYRTPAASRIIIDARPTLESASDYYTQVEMKYAHRGLTNPGATAAEQEQAATMYEFNYDGSRVAQIATQTRNGETCLSIEADWTEYPTNSASSAASIDMSRAVAALAESNNRVRLPELTFRGDKMEQRHMYCRPEVYLFPGSRFDASAPATTGAWCVIGGTLTYDVAGKKSRWTHRVRVWPARNLKTGKPTCADMKKLTSTATFKEADWILCALRHVTKTGAPPAAASKAMAMSKERTNDGDNEALPSSLSQ